MEIPDLSKDEGLEYLNNYLSDKSFMDGYKASKADVLVWEKLRKRPTDKYENIVRWFSLISSYGAERNILPSSDLSIKFAQLHIKDNPPGGEEVLLELAWIVVSVVILSPIE